MSNMVSVEAKPRHKSDADLANVAAIVAAAWLLGNLSMLIMILLRKCRLNCTFA
jgi:hypothetical protein